MATIERRNIRSQIPTHLWVYVHSCERLTIAGLLTEMIRREMRRDGINPKRARTAFQDPPAPFDNISLDVVNEELMGINDYREFVNSQITHENAQPSD
ncbi:hypothetical protein SAMN05216388_10098 [Halorientalis persicus]|uniref:Uncharacterized protein n=1 Tax=Halorientalis persicus TaxID=1367881 RepID=A0A1H8MIH5_9EURY|nr:hypothetical protein [Halorientalis persicus]SEO17080.1 hypothetical protein SAMN05216388_10098 [Halorientalis persicus]